MCHVPSRATIDQLTKLAELPYFELKDGFVHCADAVGPIVDVHTHLALSFVRRNTVDLGLKTSQARTYLSPERPLNLHRYVNTNIPKSELRAMKADLSVRSLSKRGMRQTHTAPNLVREMTALGISHAVILAIDAETLSWNTQDYFAIAEDFDQLSVGCSVHPNRPGAANQVRQWKTRGAVCMKMHPAVQRMRPDHPRAMELYEVCGEIGLPVLWHCGPVGIVSKAADARCQLKHYWGAVKAFPNTTFILGHAGALEYDLAIDLARAYDNVYLEVSCQGLIGIEQIFARVAPEKIIHGSDWPFYHQAISVAKVLIASNGNEAFARAVLYDNAVRLFDLPRAN